MRRWLPLVIGLVVGAGCVRLGVWQLDRLAERRARNAEIVRALDLAPMDPATDTADIRPYRAAWAEGTFDFEEQVLELGRPRNGAPGVWVLTPLDLGDGRRVLVNRGWVYSPDARTIDAGRVREPESTMVRGIFLAPRRGGPGVDPDTLGAGFLPLILRRTTSPAGTPDALLVLDVPETTDGPHLAYAIQWFVFGLIALVGGFLLYRREAAPRVGMAS